MVEGKTIMKDSLVGMQVINADGNIVGTVKDVAFTIGKQGVSLHVETKNDETVNIDWEEIQSAGEYILLKQKSQAQAQTVVQATATEVTQQQHLCPTCGGQLTYIPQYRRFYCYRCQKYAPA